MNFSSNNEKIEKYLDELAKEYKELLYKALISRSKPLDDLSVSELLRLDNEIKKPLLGNYQKRQKRLRSTWILGLIYIMIGLTTYLCYMMIDNKNIFSLTSVAFLVFGISIIFGSLLFETLILSKNKKMLRTTKNITREFLNYLIILKWRELEGIVNDISINANLKTSRSIIGFLMENHFIDENEHLILKNFLKMRNNVAHADDNNFSYDEAHEMIDQLDKIIDKLEKIV